MRRLTGHAAIDYAAVRGLVLSKYTDPTDEARDGLTVAEAREIARVDPSLIYLEITMGGVKDLLRIKGIDPSADYFDLSWSQVADVVEVAKAVGYRKGASVPKSTGRAFLDYVRRTKTDGDDLAARAWRETDEARRMGESPLRSHESGDDDDTDGGAR